MKANVIEAIMGGVVLIIAAFFIGFVYTTGEDADLRDFHLKAKFDRVDGLLIGNDVRLSGVKIGKVKSLSISPETFEVELTLSLKGDYKIPVDSQAEILSESLLGGKYVAIVPGGDQETLKPGDEITNTQSAISWESLITKYFLNNDKKEGEKKEEGKDGHHETVHETGTSSQEKPNHEMKPETSDMTFCPPMIAPGAVSQHAHHEHSSEHHKERQAAHFEKEQHGNSDEVTEVQ